jgi:DDE superfamily endonuclease
MATSPGVSGWRTELDGLLARFGRLFVRAEPREQAGRYLEGLLGPVERKNGWQLAEHLGDARPWRTQRVLSHVLGDEEAARHLCRDYAVERLGAEDAILVVDETGFSRRAGARPAWRASTAAPRGGSRTARSGCSAPTPAARGTPWSTAGCTCRKPGPATRSAAARSRSLTTSRS